jgi:hypothetical protein
MNKIMEEELSLRKIRVINDPNIIHYGSKGEGSFKVRDAFMRCFDLIDEKKCNG